MTAEKLRTTTTYTLSCDHPDCKATLTLCINFDEDECPTDDCLADEKVTEKASLYDWDCVVSDNCMELLAYCPAHGYKEPVTIMDVAKLMAGGMDMDEFQKVIKDGNFENLQMSVWDVVDDHNHDNLWGHEIILGEKTSDNSILISTMMGAVSIYKDGDKEPRVYHLGVWETEQLAMALGERFGENIKRFD